MDTTIITFMNKTYETMNDFIKYVENEINLGNNLNVQDESNNTMLFILVNNTKLFYANRTKCMSTIKKLIDAGVDLELRKDFYTVLETVILLGDIEIITILIEAGANVNAQDSKYGCTPLMTTIDNVRSYSYEIVKLLIKSGADLNLVDSSGYTVLMYIPQIIKDDYDVATYVRILHIAKMLIKSGASIDFEGCDRSVTVLMIASRFCYIPGVFSIAKLLIDSGANVNKQDSCGWTSLMIASRHINSHSETGYYHYYKLIEKLIDVGANLDLQNYLGHTALTYASRFSNKKGLLEVVKKLIDAGANINIKDKIGNTSLSYLVQYSNSLEVIQMVISKNAKTNLLNFRSNTLLHLCAIGIKENTSNYDILSFLETLDIDKTLKNNDGKIYLDYLEVTCYVSKICEICYSTNLPITILKCSCNCAKQCIECTNKINTCCYCKKSFSDFETIRIV